MDEQQDQTEAQPEAEAPAKDVQSITDPDAELKTVTSNDVGEQTETKAGPPPTSDEAADAEV